MTMNGLKFIAIIALVVATTSSAFNIPTQEISCVTSQGASRVISSRVPIFMSKEDGVVELVDDEPADTVTEGKSAEENGAVAPFLSQGEISEESMDLSDPKQARVAIYIILSLLPVLFLIPLMLGSRDLIPAEMMPPVDI